MKEEEENLAKQAELAKMKEEEKNLAKQAELAK